MAFVKVIVIALVVAINLEEIRAHGMMMDPVNRSSAWRKGFDTPINYTDNEHYCGGVKAMYEQNKGKCGECGDNWALPRPRSNENGGTYGTGTIVQTYKQGSEINITVNMTAGHMGHFQFSLCPLKDSKDQETEECFEKHPLMLADGSDKYLLHKFEKKVYEIPVVLPAGVTCEQCVVRWHYRTGNSWGTCDDGTSGMGCGNQEVFRSCADVRIYA